MPISYLQEKKDVEENKPEPSTEENMDTSQPVSRSYVYRVQKQD